MKFTNLDRSSCEQFRVYVLPELNKVLEKFGLAATTEGFTFLPGEHMTPKLRCVVRGSDAPDARAALLNVDKLNFEKFAPIYRLKPEWFGAPLALRGTLYTIEGFAPNSSRVKIRRSRDGKYFVMANKDVERSLVLPPAPSTPVGRVVQPRKATR